MNLKLIYLIDNIKEILVKFKLYKSFEETVCETLNRLKKEKFYDGKYRWFKDVDEAEEWGLNNYSEWTKNLKDKDLSIKMEHGCEVTTEYDAINLYLGFPYRQINPYLRTNMIDFNTDIKFIKKLIDLMGQAFENVWLKDNIISIRCMGFEGFCKWTNYKNIKENDTFIDNGFMSTTLNINIINEDTDFKKDVLLILRVSSGTRGVYANLISHRDVEAELLLYRGTNIRISKILYKLGSNVILLCDVLN